MRVHDVKAVLAKSSDVYERVKALILDNAIAPGSKITIDVLARDLGVSHTPLREALARLESDELVVKLPRRGYVCTPLLSPAQVDELYELRLMLEPPSAGRAAERMTPDGARRLRAELASCEQAPPDSGYEAYRALAAHDRRLHDLVLELAGNEAVRAAFDRTHAHLHLYRLYYGWRTGNEAINEHRDLVEALTAGDATAATEAMRQHLDLARERLHRMHG
ncbi:GntR family transcriptional regulator [Pseudonocardia sp. TRM90224]|uniref:GntR family transcriptional regulator n=1 Tax=Pseudonocardia sp. TRM90224 TaxID=2812678 RepID=UPI001E3F95BB|nr:GntR family transcriptional regulator [Pseudonocardia sp. TRM90224]